MEKPQHIEFLVFMHEGAMRGFCEREYHETYTPRQAELVGLLSPESFDGRNLFPFGIGEKTLRHFSLLKGEPQPNRLYPVRISCYPLEDLQGGDLTQFEQNARLFFRRCACHIYELNGKLEVRADSR
jgi:hypothetical protein